MGSRKTLLTVAAAAAVICAPVVSKILAAPAGATTATGFGAVATEKGGQDVYGPYQVAADWPKPMSQLPGHGNWTWGSVDGVFAQNANRVYILQRGEVPV